MAQAKAKPAAKSAKKSAEKPTAGDQARSKVPTAAAEMEKSDPDHPDIHPSRHAKSGLQEPNTAGASAGDENESPVGGGMRLIGANAPDKAVQPGSQPIDVARLQAQDFVWSHDQALSLPVVRAGTEVKPLGDAELERVHKRMAAEQVEDSFETTGDDVQDRKDRAKATKDAEASMRRRTPIYAFKDPADRRTYVVVKTNQGLARRLSKLYQGTDEDLQAA